MTTITTIVGIATLATIWFVPPRIIEITQAEILDHKTIEMVTAVVTGYNSDPRQTDEDPKVAADGHGVYVGLAACPRRYPFGTIINIDGTEYHCGDRTHRRNDGIFDIWFPERADAIEWGRQEKLVRVLKIPTLVERALPLDGKRGGECVYFIQWFLGLLADPVDQFRGYAGHIEPNANDPAVGRIVLLDYKHGHAALIIEMTKNGLVLAESNFKLDGRIGVGRTIPIDSPHIRGYFDVERMGVYVAK